MPDYIAMKLTGKAVIDPSNAGINQLMSLEKKDWEDEILDYLGITRRQLPKIADSGAVIGTLCPAAARELGLPQDALVAAGGHDQYCAALGAGAVENGDILVASGTAWVVTAISEKPRFDNPARPNQSLHTVPGKWGALLSLESGGICLEWLRKSLNTLRAGAPLSLKEIDAGAAQCPAGANGALFYPYITPATYPPEAAGCPSTLLGLTITQDGFAVARAVMEGVVYQVLWMPEAFRRPACGRTDVDRRRGQKRPLDSDTGGCCSACRCWCRESPTPPVSARPSWQGSARACSAMPARAAAQRDPKHARFTPMNRTGRCMKRATAASKAPCGRCRPVTANKRPVYENLSNERVMSHGIV